MRSCSFTRIIVISYLTFSFSFVFSQNDYLDSLFVKKGEIYFSLNTPKNKTGISKIISIDHKTNSKKTFAYANKSQFINFLDLEIEFEIINDDIDSLILNGSRANWNFYPNYQEVGRAHV